MDNKMWRAVVVVGVLLGVAGGQHSNASPPAARPKPVTQAKAPPPTPNVTPQCSMTFTAPTAYSRDFTASDYCKMVNISTPVILFESRKSGVGGDMITDRALSVRVDPAVAAGTAVALTGTAADKVQLQYTEGKVEANCVWFTGTATVVTQRPNLDVTFDATCVSPANAAANGMHLKGEFKSTL